MSTKNAQTENVSSQALLSSNFLLTEAEVLELISVSKSTLRRWVRSSEFPPPVQLPGRRVAWRARDLNTWLNSLIDVSWSPND